ncbi:membrane hypothetical protein [Vibrio nigripulchritudo MADA3029]|nr:membrane hypothetical protein [Vibrio nigripulchritudo MADA3020]CCN52072.1 membrane hypothetical protein [Vibrio nigripulchritudo MADA3021]CCN58199.1 membrane hypothetical protein [Vibrio nigripulchritudo MADA3029]
MFLKILYASVKFSYFVLAVFLCLSFVLPNELPEGRIIKVLLFFSLITYIAAVMVAWVGPIIIAIRTNDLKSRYKLVFLSLLLPIFGGFYTYQKCKSAGFRTEIE